MKKDWKGFILLMQKDIKESSIESDELEVLVILVKDYENEHFSIPKPNPVEAIRFRLEQVYPEY